MAVFALAVLPLAVFALAVFALAVSALNRMYVRSRCLWSVSFRSAFILFCSLSDAVSISTTAEFLVTSLSNRKGLLTFDSKRDETRREDSQFNIDS